MSAAEGDLDDVPVSALISKKLESAQEKEKQKAAERDIASDSEDDIPVMELIKRRLAKKERENQEKEKERERERAREKAKEKEREKRRRGDSDDEDEKKSKKDKRRADEDVSDERIAKASSGSNAKANAFYQTEKGKLVQTLLVRWWYAYDWPLPEDIGTPPPGYESLDGFPGVFVSTRIDSLGRILDLRNKERCPCLSRFVKEPSAKLKEMCMEALKNQMTALEGTGESTSSKLYLSLKAEMAEIRKIDPMKADKSGKSFENSFEPKHLQ